MAENVTLARPYAEAAFHIAGEAKQLDGWDKALAQMAAVAADPEMRALIENPLVDVATVVRVFTEVTGPALSAEQKNFVQLLADNDRLLVLGEIRDLFGDLKNGIEGVKEAQIVSAFPIDAAAQAKLVADLERRFACKIQASVSVDPELIGGVRIAVGDQVIDASVRGKLAQMATALKN